MSRRTLLVWLLMAPAILAKDAPLRQGRIVAVDVKDLMAGKKLLHRYVCTVGDEQFNYTVEFEKPLKLAINDPVQFELKNDTLTLRDADGKKRSTKVEKRERVAAAGVPPPAPGLPPRVQ